MISAKILGYYWIDGKINLEDIVSKHWSYLQVWHLLKPLILYSGDTFDLLEEENIVTRKHIDSFTRITITLQYISKRIDSTIITCYAERATISSTEIDCCVVLSLWKKRQNSKCSVLPLILATCTRVQNI
jgi:hypothetical protein